jgi:hypothetical protein
MSDKDDKMVKVEGWGDSFLGAMIAIAIAVILFSGEPDIAESARVWIGKAAGTIPADYVWKKEE